MSSGRHGLNAESFIPIGNVAAPFTPDPHAWGSSLLLFCVEPLRDVRKKASFRSRGYGTNQPISLLSYGLHRHSSALERGPGVHEPAQMFMPRGCGRKCAAASHTSRRAGPRDTHLSPRHCAQKFSENAKLTISLSNILRRRVAA